VQVSIEYEQVLNGNAAMSTEEDVIDHKHRRETDVVKFADAGGSNADES
jgi:hypothetical protein